MPDVGERFVEDIVTRIEALREHPDMGRIVPAFEHPFLRELIRPPFRIVYRRDPKHVRIVRVWRADYYTVILGAMPSSTAYPFVTRCPQRPPALPATAERP